MSISDKEYYQLVSTNKIKTTSFTLFIGLSVIIKARISLPADGQHWESPIWHGESAEAEACPSSYNRYFSHTRCSLFLGYHTASTITGIFHKLKPLIWTIQTDISYYRLQENRITAWKFCHLLHKVLREGHSLCCQQSMRHRGMLSELGKLWVSHELKSAGLNSKFQIRMLSDVIASILCAL